MVDNIMVPCHNKNCEDDVDEFLLNVSNLSKGEPVVDVPLPDVGLPTDYQQLVSQLPELDTTIRRMATLSLRSANKKLNVLVYIAGYIARKLRKGVCIECLAKASGHPC